MLPSYHPHQAEGVAALVPILNDQIQPDRDPHLPSDLAEPDGDLLERSVVRPATPLVP